MSNKPYLDGEFEYFSGRKLRGDDFDIEQLENWYRAEANAYAQILEGEKQDFTYAYHALNIYHGFSRITAEPRARALGLGSAHCEEFRPIVPLLSEIVCLEPAESFSETSLEGIPITRLRPSISGEMTFESDSFDIVTCFGVLHHVANVSSVVRECYRVLKPGGFMLCREPIVSMGDWRFPRRGLTPNERGIPIELLDSIVKTSGFDILRSVLIDFPPLSRLSALFGIPVFSSKAYVRLDELLCSVFAFNRKYHRVSLLEKFGAASVFLILRK